MVTPALTVIISVTIAVFTLGSGTIGDRVGGIWEIDDSEIFTNVPFNFPG